MPDDTLNRARLPPRAQGRPLRRRVRDAGYRLHAEERRVRLRPVRHRALGLPLRDHQERAALLRGGAAAGDRARAVQGIPPHRPRRRHGCRRHHAADGQRRAEARRSCRLLEVHADRSARGGAGRGARSLPGRSGPRQARRGQRPDHLLRPDRDPRRRRERGRDRGARGRRLPLGRPFRPVRVPWASRPVRAPGLPRRDRRGRPRLQQPRQVDGQAGPGRRHRCRLLGQGLRLPVLLGRRLGLPSGGEGGRGRHPRRLRNDR